MKLKLNGEAFELTSGTTVADLLSQMDLKVPRVAVERNRQVVPRATYSQVELQEGDEIEVVSFFGGG